MKRANEGVVGLRRASDFRFDVAGSPLRQARIDVASFRHALNDPLATRESDSDLLAEFEEFLVGDRAFDQEALPTPDPAFQERLRRRLWRTQLLTQQRDRGDAH